MACLKLTAKLVELFQMHDKEAGQEESLKNVIVKWCGLSAEVCSHWDIVDTNCAYFGRFLMRQDRDPIYKLLLTLLLNTTPCVNELHAHALKLGFDVDVHSLASEMRKDDGVVTLNARIIFYLLLKESNSVYFSSYSHQNHVLASRILVYNLDNEEHSNLIRSLLLMNCPEVVNHLSKLSMTFRSAGLIKAPEFESSVSAVMPTIKIQTSDFVHKLNDTLSEFSGALSLIEEADRSTGSRLTLTNSGD